MRVLIGRVVHGQVVIEGGQLAEGASVMVLALDEGTFDVGPEDEAELLERIAEGDPGEFVDEAELFERLRSQG